ncbi:penicillin-binding transpeptidase domain-containing protein [Streptomyces sp. 1331.2]|uniref:penicillin-binding transpeptidase domain-containing protein n=1 Tax=Streptomyces sp. 1331.2 TaxID=1938835 RepID=UPI000BCC206D|nr:penicillin-binding transpeptidase domain-containing protein [Streptomyces sp. 1331.2]SOB85531.1 NTF2-like N-terminal transpeptidase domain-containing protein [Streptomyces sp. 1331.2]
MQDEQEYDAYEDEAQERAPRRPAAKRILLVTAGGVFAALLAVGGYGAYNIVNAVSNGNSSPGAAGHQGSAGAAQTPQEPATAEQAEKVSAEFLAAWSRGDVAAAAGLTDSPETARAALATFHEQVAARTLTLTGTGPAPAAPAGQPAAPAATTSPSAPTAPAVGFRAKAEFDGATGAWEYDSALSVVRAQDGRAVVHWTPTVIHPRLGPGRTIAVKALPDPVSKPTDRNGKPLDGFPSLSAVLPLIAPADGTTAVTGRAVVVSGGAGKEPEQLFVLTPPSAPQVKLTLDADLQQVAEEAVKQQSAGGKPASLVAVQPSTGHILAMAYSPSGFNRAVAGGQPPGSTMKVITSAALLQAGVTPDTVVPCKETTYSPRAWHNDDSGDFPSYTLTDDFTHSCNTGFIDKGLEKLPPGTLTKVARDQFGLGLEWHIGIPSRDATIPVPGTKDEAAAEYIGQGQIQVNSLLMASVAATVQNGTFRQPVLREDAKRVTAPGTLPADVARDLRAMMARTATQGTARAPMSGLSGQIGAKTGTVEAGSQATNSWFIAYRGDLAVAAEVEGGGHGNSAAGVAAAQVLKAGGKG